MAPHQMVNSESHWEPPIREPLLISATKLADILDVPRWKASEIAWVLDRRFYSEGQRTYRITMASVKEYLELQEAGLEARAIMAQRQEYGWSPTETWGLTPRSARHHMRRAKRRGY